MDDAERVPIESRADWRAWLAANHGQDAGVWVVRYKKRVPDKHVSYDAVVEEALCFGWIDSLPRKLDADRTMLYCSPRRPRSPWSKLNKQRIEALQAAGQMTPAGQAKIDEAQADGSWSVYDSVDNLVVPDDLADALRANPAAERHFDAFSDSAKKGLLWWIKSARRPATRARRIEQTVAQAAENAVANQ